MFILLVNKDPLGRSLAATLVANGHEVSYLDAEEEYCQMVSMELGCLVTQGETTNINVLKEAGIERADVVVALLEKDIKNVMVAIFARQFEVPLILARLQQEHYRSAYELAGIHRIFSAFKFLQNDILISIEEPNVRHVMNLGDGRIEIASVVLPQSFVLADRPVSDLWNHQRFPKGALVLGLLEVSNQTFRLPSENPKLHEGDELLVIGTAEDVHKINEIVTRLRSR